jgi:hypothetical protein
VGASCSCGRLCVGFRACRDAGGSCGRWRFRRSGSGDRGCFGRLGRCALPGRSARFPRPTVMAGECCRCGVAARLSWSSGRSYRRSALDSMSGHVCCSAAGVACVRSRRRRAGPSCVHRHGCGCYLASPSAWEKRKSSLAAGRFAGSHWACAHRCCYDWCAAEPARATTNRARAGSGAGDGSLYRSEPSAAVLLGFQSHRHGQPR